MVPLVFGEAAQDPLGEYGSSDESAAPGADRRVFGALKLVNRYTVPPPMSAAQVPARTRSPICASIGGRRSLSITMDNSFCRAENGDMIRR